MTHTSNTMKGRKLSFGFFFDKPLRIPGNLREYYISVELLRRGHRVCWFCGEKEGNYTFRRKIPTVCIRSKKEIKGSSYVYPFYLAYFLARKRIRCVWLSGWGERCARDLLFTALVLKRLGFKIVYDPIDPIYEHQLAIGKRFKPGEEDKLKGQLNRIYKLSDITLTVTEELRSLIVGRGAPAQKVHVAWWGTDIERFNLSKLKRDLREEYGLENKFIVGWLGRMAPFKGVEEIIIPLMKKLEMAIDNVCFFIGGTGKLERRFLDLKEKLNAPLIFFGEIPYDFTPAFTKALDVYIIPTNPDSEFARSIRPVKMFDALASGTPVVVSKTAATMTLSRTFKCIHYADEYNLHGFFNAVMHFYKNYKEVKRLSLSEAGKAENYSHQKVSKDVVDLLERELGGA